MLSLRTAIAAALLAGPASWLIACASSDPSAASGGSDLSAGSSSGSKSNAKGIVEAGTEAAAPRPSAATCQAKASSDACFSCCVGDGTALTVGDKAFQTCAMNAAQACGSACVAIFADTDEAGAPADPFGDSSGDPCAACETGLSACSNVADKACAANASCAAATKCLDDAKCEDKDPSSDGEAGTSDSTDYSSPGG